MKLLCINCSIQGEKSVSKQLTAKIVAQLSAQNPNVVVDSIDLAAEPIAHFDEAAMAIRNAHDVDTLTPEQANQNAITERYLNQFLAADIVVIAAPFYNLTIPSQLKAWIDRVCIAGRTFKYSAQGIEGLAAGKRVIIVSTRGGIFSTEKGEQLEHQESYLRAIFKFMGVSNIQLIRAEGLSKSAEKQKALADAIENIARLELA